MAEPYLQQLRALVDEFDFRSETSSTLECRHLFGGAALWADDRICVSLTPAGLALKLSVGCREAMIRDGRGLPLRYFEGGRVKKEYVLLSEPLRSDLPAVRALFLDSFRHVCSE